MKRSHQFLVILLSSTLLGGCLLVSPYAHKILGSRTEAIPFQAWTSQTGGSLIVECRPTNRFGPSTPRGDWSQVITIPISTTPSLDLFGAAMYSASRTIRLNQGCWWQSPSNSWYYTSIRVIQQDYYGEDQFVYHTLDRPGVDCVGESVGRTGSWVSWLQDSCQWKLADNATPAKYVIMRTQNP